jgi:hypothetical protein
MLARLVRALFGVPLILRAMALLVLAMVRTPMILAIGTAILVGVQALLAAIPVTAAITIAIPGKAVIPLVVAALVISAAPIATVAVWPRTLATMAV